MVGVGAVGVVRAFGSVVCAIMVVMTASSAVRAQCTLPYTLTNGQIADASQVMTNFNVLANCIGPGGSTNSVQYNNGGALDGVAPMSNGQLVIGTTGKASQAQVLTAGPGISITTGSGSIAIATNGTEGGNGLYSHIMSATPTTATTGLAAWLNQGSATVADNAVGITIDAPSSGAAANLIARYVAAPSPPYTITALITATRNSNNVNGVGIGWYDGTDKLHVLSHVLNNSSSLLQVHKWTNATTFSASDFNSHNNGFAFPLWLQIKDDGTNVAFAFSQDGALFVPLFSIAKSSGFLGASGYSNLVFFVNPQSSRTFATLLSWGQN